MKKYPSLNYPDHDETNGLLADGKIFVQEKLDGANFRFCREENLDKEYHTDNREIVFGSRNIAYKNEKDVDKTFSHAVEYVRERVSDEDMASIEESIGGPVTIFGEALHPHTLEYDFEEIPNVVAFDIWNHSSAEFVSPIRAKHFVEQTIGLEFSPILDIVEVSDWKEYEMSVPKSAYGNVKAEGMVLKNPTTNVYAKIVREEFKEKHTKSFGKPKKHQDMGEEKLSYRYIPNARIEKQVHKLIDEGDWDSKQMEMMEELPEAVIRDMANEEMEEILMSKNWTVDIQEFRSITSSRCATHLRKMINSEHFSPESDE